MEKTCEIQGKKYEKRKGRREIKENKIVGSGNPNRIHTRRGGKTKVRSNLATRKRKTKMQIPLNLNKLSSNYSGLKALTHACRRC